MAQPLGELAENTVVRQQRGGISGRVMGDAILDIETHALLCTRMAATWPAIVCFDLKAAFPSIAWVFIFAVLSCLGVPERVVEYIRRLY